MKKGSASLEHRNADSLIYKGACKVHSIFVDADGAAAQVDVYDGVDTTGERKFRINAISDDSKFLLFTEPAEFDMGVYIDVNAATTFVTIQVSPTLSGHFAESET